MDIYINAAVHAMHMLILVCARLYDWSNAYIYIYVCVSPQTLLNCWACNKFKLGGLDAYIHCIGLAERLDASAARLSCIPSEASFICRVRDSFHCALPGTARDQECPRNSNQVAQQIVFFRDLFASLLGFLFNVGGWSKLSLLPTTTLDFRLNHKVIKWEL